MDKRIVSELLLLSCCPCLKRFDAAKESFNIKNVVSTGVVVE